MYFNRIKFRQQSQKFRVDLILRMSRKTAENGNFWEQMESFDWFQFGESAISHVFASFNFAKSAKIREIVKFNLAKINQIKVFPFMLMLIPIERQSINEFLT